MNKVHIKRIRARTAILIWTDFMKRKCMNEKIDFGSRKFLLAVMLGVGFCAEESLGDFWVPQVTGHLGLGSLDEASGLAISRGQAEVMWVNNDAGDSARVFAVGLDGANLGKFKLDNIDHVDYEDIAIGAGPLAGTDYLYVGDIGDNEAARGSISIYRFAEPTVDMKDNSTQTVNDVERIRLRYPDGSHDAETLMIDPMTGDLLIGSKREATFNLYRVTQDEIAAAGGEKITMRLESSVAAPGLVIPFFNHWATGGDISADGKIISVRTHHNVLFWQREAGQSIGDAMNGQPVTLGIDGYQIQGEAIAFTPDGLGFYTVQEGEGTPVKYYEMPTAGDFNDDGLIDGLDLDLLAGNFGNDFSVPSKNSFLAGDLNFDGKIDLKDLFGLRNASIGSAAVSVPEPSGILMLGVLCGGALMKRKQ